MLKQGYYPICQRTYRTFLPDFMALFIMSQSSLKYRMLYSPVGFHRKILKGTLESIKRPPSYSIMRLLKRNTCVYCGYPYNTFDHICTRLNNSASSMVPCCRSCNSSKGPKDLIHWWVVFLNHQIYQLNEDVIKIYCRIKYEIIELEGLLDEPIPDYYQIAFEQLIEDMNKISELSGFREGYYYNDRESGDEE